MRAYFAPNGVGLGHVGRCVPIAKRLVHNNSEVLFSTYGEGLDYVEHENFPLIKAPPIGLKVKPDGTVDFRQTAIKPGPFLASFTLMRQVNTEIRAMESYKPDIVISDSRATPLLAASILNIPTICILNQFQIIIPRTRHLLRLARFADVINLTIVGKIWTLGRMVLIPDFPAPNTISVGNLTIPQYYRKKVKLIGGILPKYSSELPSQKDLRKKLGLSSDRTAIFAPISGPVGEKKFLIKILKKIFMKLPNDYEIIFSLGSPNTDPEPVSYGNTRIFNWIPNRFEYLKASDLVIARAGHSTIMQSIFYGKPMILVPTPSHSEQLSNAMQAEKIGVANVIGQDRLNKESLLAKVKGMLNITALEKLEEIQLIVQEYNGLEKAVREIIEITGNNN